jgi:hypothetical protein
MDNDEVINKLYADADLTPQKVAKTLGNKILLLCAHAVEGRLHTNEPLNTFLRYHRHADDPSKEEIELLQRLEELKKADLDRLIRLIAKAAKIQLEKYLPAEHNGDFTYAGICEFFLKQNKISEVVRNGDDLAFVVFDPTTGKLEVTDAVEIDGRIVKPPTMGLKYLPAVPQAIADDPMLWRDTRRFIRLHVDLPDESLYDMLTAFVALSWLYDAPGVETVPELLLIGPYRSGKSRTLEVLESICRFGTHQGNVTSASSFHLIEAYRPTMLIDLRSWRNVSADTLDLLNHCYRRGLKIWRVVDPSLPGERGLRSYEPYALVAVAAHDEPPTDIFSRYIKIHMERNRRAVRKKIDLEEAARLRTRWLAQRFRHYFDFVVFNTEYKSEDSRLSEIVSPLVVCAHIFGGPEAEDAVRRYAATVEEEHKVEETTSVEAKVLSALVVYLEQQSSDAPEYISASDLLPYLRDDGDEDTEFSPHRIGRVLARLGFKKVRLGGRKRGFVVDNDLIERLRKRFIEAESSVIRKSSFVDIWLHNTYILPTIIAASSRRSSRGYDIINVTDNVINDIMSQRQNSAVPSQNNNDISNIINDICGGLNVTSIPATDDNRRFINHVSPAHQPSTTPLNSSREETAGDSNLDAKTANPTSAPQAESRVFKGLDAARDLLKSQVESLPDVFRLFIADFSVDQWGYATIRCQCGSNFGGIDDFVSHVRAGSCRARRCSCGDSWLTLSELLEHVRKTNCSINPSPPPDPPEKGTKRRWRRLHRNGGFLEVGDCE